MSFPDLEQAGCGPSNVEGWEFQTTSSLTVSALGVYDYDGDGMDVSTPVGLYDSDCRLLASAAIPAGTSAPLRQGYRYVGVTPVVLAGGQTFRVAAVTHCDDYSPEFNSLESVLLASGVTAVQTRRLAFGASLACPTQTASMFMFAPNFLIGPACGNDVVQAGEECEDGNTDDGDCCSSTCQLESGNPCPAPPATATFTATPSATPPTTATPSRTASPTQSNSATATPARTHTPTQTPSATTTITPPRTATPTATVTATRTVPSTQASSPTSSVAPTDAPTATPSATATPTPLLSAASPTTAPCVGDCDGTATVDISELLTGVSVALERQLIDRCPAFDSSHSGSVEIVELTSAVNNVLKGCPSLR